VGIWLPCFHSGNGLVSFRLGISLASNLMSVLLWMISVLVWVNGREGMIKPKPPIMLSWMFSLSFIGFIASKSPVEESVMFYERGISPSNMLLSFFVKHSSQSSCTSKMSFFGYFSKCFSPNNSLGLVLLSIFSLLHFSPNSPLEMLLSICSS